MTRQQPGHPVRNQPQPVVLLHGLARSSHSMRPVASCLERHGLNAINLGYPSNRAPIEELAAQLYDRLTGPAMIIGSRLDFVTHSMGGILVRYLARHYPQLQIGRVVMLSPPNQGSELVDHLAHLRLFRWLNGPAGQQLGTGSGSIPLQLGPAPFCTGIITGDVCSEWYFNRFFAGPNDGKVSVARARLEGMQDFLIVPQNHTFIMRDRAVHRQILHFLQQGSFSHAGE